MITGKFFSRFLSFSLTENSSKYGKIFCSIAFLLIMRKCMSPPKFHEINYHCLYIFTRENPLGIPIYPPPPWSTNGQRRNWSIQRFVLRSLLNLRDQKYPLRKETGQYYCWRYYRTISCSTFSLRKSSLFCHCDKKIPPAVILLLMRTQVCRNWRYLYWRRSPMILEERYWFGSCEAKLVGAERHAGFLTKIGH